jgi:Flp pilus assembly protein TadD
VSILKSLTRRVATAVVCCVAAPLAAQEVTISASTEDARRLFLEGRDNFHMTRFATARELLEETVAEEPDLALAHAYLALAESFTYHDPASSLAAARDPAARANPGERLMADALASFLANDLAGAVSTLLDVLTTFPEDPYARHALGFTLVDFGVRYGESSMSRTVSLPAAIAAKLILEDRIDRRGVLRPVHPEIYNPVLDELANLNIVCTEEKTVY